MVPLNGTAGISKRFGGSREGTRTDLDSSPTVTSADYDNTNV
jgi:hypothetical protein